MEGAAGVGWSGWLLVMGVALGVGVAVGAGVVMMVCGARCSSDGCSGRDEVISYTIG